MAKRKCGERAIEDQKFPDALCPDWESRVLLATFYSDSYADKMERWKASIEKHVPHLRWAAFRYEPKLTDYHGSSDMERPRQMSKALHEINDLQEYRDIETVVWTDADMYFLREPTEAEMIRVIGDERYPRFATTNHGPKKKPRLPVPCPSFMCVRGYEGFEFVHAWAHRVNDMWKDYCADPGCRGYSTCNGSMLETRTMTRWMRDPMFDFTIPKRIWSSAKRKETNPVMLNSHEEDGDDE